MQHRVFGSPPQQTQLYSKHCMHAHHGWNQTFLTLFTTRNKVTATMTTATVSNITPATEPPIAITGLVLITMVTGGVPTKEIIIVKLLLHPSWFNIMSNMYVYIAAMYSGAQCLVI